MSNVIVEKKQGRPTKLNEEMIIAIEDAARRLYYVEAIANYVGLNKDTVYTWLNRGEAEWDDEASIYKRFYDRLKKAQAENKEELLAGIKAGKANDWQGKAWILERCHPKEFGRVDRLQVTGANGGALEINHITSDDRQARISELIKQLPAERVSELLKSRDIELEGIEDAEMLEGGNNGES